MDGFTLFLIACGIGILNYCVFLFMAISRLNKEIKNGVSSCKTVPSKFLPLSRIKEATLQDVVDYHVLSREIQRLADDGKTEYSSFQFKYISGQLQNYANVNFFCRRHYVLFILSILFFMPMGFIPLIIFGVVMLVQYQSATKAERIFNQFIRGELIKPKGPVVTNSSPTSAADEISKLHKLKQDGVLSDEEFQAAKKKLVG